MNIKIFFIISGFFMITSCCKEDNLSQHNSIGTITVDLDANELAVRKSESLIGNMICDAIKLDSENKGFPVDFAIINSGAIRFNKERFSNGIYPAGPFSSEMIDEMMPFANSSVVIKITGRELKSVFERSVAQLPLAKGPFLQISKEIKVEIDTTKNPQVINELVNPPVIVSNGNRISSIKINNANLDSSATYTMVTSDFISNGEDGYIIPGKITADKKHNLGEDQVGAIKEYLIVHSPITPRIESRIVYK